MKQWAIFLSCLALCGTALAQTAPSEEQSVRRFVERYDDVLNHKEATAVERILAPEYVYFSSKGEVVSRRSLLNELLSPNYLLLSAQRSEIEVHLTSGTAVVSSRWKGQGTFDNRPFHDDQRCSIVLVRGREDWQVLAEHCTQIVAP
jgi:hypothetical protein